MCPSFVRAVECDVLNSSEGSTGERPQDDRRMYAEYLRVCGFSPVQAGDTREALRIAWLVDVVVTGMRVPGPFDGLDLIRHLRGDHRTDDKPFDCADSVRL
jgi:CheY-like chemotaxis protein